MINVGIVILNWNGYEDTIECLLSLEKIILTNIDLKVVVVDNNSMDDSVTKIRDHSSKSVLSIEILVSDRNLGFAGGNNIGIKYLLNENVQHVLILNNDTHVDKNFLVNLLRVAKKKPNYGIFSPKIYFAKGYEFHKGRYKNEDLGKVIWSAGGEMDWNNVFGKNNGVDEVDGRQYDKVKEINFATGAAMLINKRLLKRVGMFDEKYFMYFEDADLVTRAILAGSKVYYVPRSKVWHKVAQSSAIGGDLNDYFITRNRLLFGTRYAPLRTKIALYKESFRLAFGGRTWQKIGAMDFYFRKFGMGSWKK